MNPYDLSSLKHRPPATDLLNNRVAQLERAVDDLTYKLSLLYGMVKPLIEIKETE